MKKKSLVLIICLITIVLLVGCNKKDNNDKLPNDNQTHQVQQEEKVLNEKYNLENSINDIKEITGEETKILTEEEISQKYNLTGIENLETKVLVNTSENNYEEIAIIKLTNSEQQFTVQKMMFDRYQQLKEEYIENEAIYKILDNMDNFKIKVQDGVGIFIISSNAEELMKKFDKAF